MYSYGPRHMAGQKQDDQHEHTYSSYVRILDVALKICQRWWTIGKSGERGSGISVLVARQDDDDDMSIRPFRYVVLFWECFFFLRGGLAQKIFSFLFIWLLIRLFNTDLVEFIFIILEGLVLLVLLASVPVSSESPHPLFVLIFLFFLFLPIVLSILPAVVFFVFSLDCVLVYFSFLDTFACSHSFFICPSTLISHPVFVFLFEFMGFQRYFMILIAIWLHSGLFYSYPTLSCWFNFLDMKAVKELYERRR